MQFKVPQFIDIEDKLFRSFHFLSVCLFSRWGGLIFVIYKILPLWIGIFLILPVGGLTFLLVFYKINNKPFIYYLQAGITYFISSKLYLWKQRLAKPEDKEKEETPVPLTSVVPMTTEDRLKDLSWSLDVQDKNNQ